MTFDHSVKSDHLCIIFTANIRVKRRSRKIIQYRKWKKVDTQTLGEDISQTCTISEDMSVSDAVEMYETHMRQLADKHAPVKTCTVTSHPESPWYNDSVRAAKRQRRKLERQYRRTRLTIHKQLHSEQCNMLASVIESAKSDFYKDIINTATGQKEVFEIANRLLFKSKSPVLPSHTSDAELANRFSTFFTEKISIIRQSFQGPDDVAELPPIRNSSPLSTFKSVTENEILKLVSKCPVKSCLLDPLPTWLLKETVSFVIPVWTAIINSSLSEGVMPEQLKTAIVTPLIKKKNLDSEVLKNYRPISNLTYISKLIERVVASQFKEHMDTNGLCEEYQSAYRSFHSTETALLKVQNDILMGLDTDGAAILVLLDLSAAFDTVDHSVLLTTLQNGFNVKDTALRWFTSYLTDRKQTVVIKGTKSDAACLEFGVPQGSVLGPLLFTCYTAPLGDIVRSYNLRMHLYADDTQVYLSFKPLDSSSANFTFSIVEACVKSIKSWMSSNYLKLNDDKTELIVFHSPRIQNKVQLPSFHIGDIEIPPTQQVRNLGVIFDSGVSMEPHIQNICRQSYFHLRNIAMIRRYLDVKSAQCLVQACVSSRLDYCNSLLYGVSKQTLYKLQKVQNSCARLILQVNRSEHISPTLKTLHWLPINLRIDYKILLLVFKCLNSLAPQYLAELLTPYQPARSLRSSDESLLQVPLTRTRTFGDRSFSRAAPGLWNQLPSSLRAEVELSSFKAKLKTHLFALAFE